MVYNVVGHWLDRIGYSFTSARQVELKLGSALLTRMEAGADLALVLWVAGASFYFYMPIASMTNPPMNWGYPRTKEGFFHALTRGQYDKTNPTDSIFKFFGRSGMYFTRRPSTNSAWFTC